MKALVNKESKEILTIQEDDASVGGQWGWDLDAGLLAWLPLPIGASLYSDFTVVQSGDQLSLVVQKTSKT